MTPRVEIVQLDAAALRGLADGDQTAAESVTVVEWGQGLVEHLTDGHLEVRLERGDDDVRTALLVPHGPGWEQRIG